MGDWYLVRRMIPDEAVWYPPQIEFLKIYGDAAVLEIQQSVCRRYFVGPDAQKSHHIFLHVMVSMLPSRFIRPRASSKGEHENFGGSTA